MKWNDKILYPWVKWANKINQAHEKAEDYTLERADSIGFLIFFSLLIIMRSFTATHLLF
jgi:hypothetical protein